jgi:hypothetical protein
MTPPDSARKKIGFEVKEPKPAYGKKAVAYKSRRLFSGLQGSLTAEPGG